ncbi:MAG: SGNH/GDSL hydrolase family protein [Myxococcota bacterium]
MKWVLLLVFTLLGVVLAEGVASVLVDEVYLQRRSRMGGILVPYAPNTAADLLADEFRVGFSINRFGHRDRADRSETPTPDTTRVVVLGDSFSAGWGVEFEDTYAYRVEEATGVEMINAAKNGGCPLWFVPQARYTREHFSPDWFVVQLFDNDPEDNVIHMNRFDLEVGDVYTTLPERLEPPTGVRSLIQRFDASVLRRRFRQLSRRLRGKRLHSTPYVKPGRKADQPVLSREEAIEKHGVRFDAERPLSTSWAFHDPEQTPQWEERIAWNAQLLGQLLEEARAAGIRVAVLYIPAYDVFLRPPGRNPHAESAREVTEAHGAVWIDAQQALAGTPRPWELYHAYDGHLNAPGHAAIATLLGDRMAEHW